MRRNILRRRSFSTSAAAVPCSRRLRTAAMPTSSSRQRRSRWIRSKRRDFSPTAREGISSKTRSCSSCPRTAARTSPPLTRLRPLRFPASHSASRRAFLSWTETGDADCGVVYATDAAISDKVKVAAKAPADSHKPVIYPAAILKDTKHMDEAKSFLDFVSSEKGMAILKKYGFEAASK